MIHDKISNIERYAFLQKLKNFDIKKFKKGKFEIYGKDFFGIGLEYNTKNKNDCLWEAHQKYLDIHYILEGEEIINIAEKEKMESTMEFDYTNDYQLFKGEKEQGILLKKGNFLVLYPNECHQTGVINNKVSSVKKIVFKIKY